MKNSPPFQPVKSGKATAHLKPRKIVVPMAEGLQWQAGGFLYQVKEDGRFDVVNIQHPTSNIQHRIAAERINGRCGSHWVAFDCLEFSGEDIRQWPTRERWRVLGSLRADIEAHGGRLVETGNGGEFLEYVLGRGGEGIVAKDWAAPYGEMWACKRVETFLCVVTAAAAATQSVAVADAVTREPRGRVPLLGGKCDRVKVGSILKLEGYGLTARGLIREPRIDKDSPGSWLVQY